MEGSQGIMQTDKRTVLQTWATASLKGQGERCERSKWKWVVSETLEAKGATCEYCFPAQLFKGVLVHRSDRPVPVLGQNSMSGRSVSRNGKLDRQRAGVRTLPVVTQQRWRPHKLMFSLIQIHLHIGIFLGRSRYEGSYIHVPSSLFSQTREPTSKDTPGAASTPSTQHLISNTILQKQGTMLHGEKAPGLGQKTHLWIGTHTYPWVTKHLYFCVPSAERPWKKNAM